ncbi:MULTISPECIES: YeeE/YedE family protein [Methylobacteriaceae]
MSGAKGSIIFAKSLLILYNYRQGLVWQVLFRASTRARPAGSGGLPPRHRLARARAMLSYLPSFAGGLLIGLSAAMLILLNGRVAGVSGILAGLGRPGGLRWLADGAFLLGLMLGPVAFAGLTGAWPQMRIAASLPILALAGLLVGFGTRLGSGCTSGHGVCGLARLSPRSLAAVLTFLASGVLTVTLVRVLS